MSIKVGDLVVVVHACCPRTDYVGNIRTVGEIRQNYTRCPDCGCSNTCIHAGIVGFRAGLPLSWLRKSPPLSELESTETKEETHA